MLRLLVTWAVCGAAVTVVSDDTPSSRQREWTNASGTKRAYATLLRVEGNKLRLRRADGKLVSVTISKLSERDRQYVASRRAQLAADSDKPTVASEVVEGVTETIETIKELPRRLSESQLDVLQVPAALVYVRVSRDFLEDYVERTVRQRKAVRDCVLGARIVGESDMRGKTRLTLIPHDHQLKAHIAFHGTVRARTRGYKGPVVLHNVSDSTFQARKLLAMDDSGLRVAPATARAPTRLRTNCISTSLPRLRGRIATRIAWRRTRNSHGRAQAITADHTADDIRSDFDQRINRSMAKVQKVFGSKLPDLETGKSPMPTDVRFRSKTDYLEMAILREDATAKERKLRPPLPQEETDISVRVHRKLFTSAIEDPQLMQNLAPLFAKLLEARANQETGAGRTSKKGTKDTDAKWAIDLEWVSLDFKDANR